MLCSDSVRVMNYHYFFFPVTSANTPYRFYRPYRAYYVTSSPFTRCLRAYSDGDINTTDIAPFIHLQRRVECFTVRSEKKEEGKRQKNQK